MEQSASSSQPARFRVRIHQARKLRTYLRGGGLTRAAGGSNFGAQLERVARYSVAARPCPRCARRRRVVGQASARVTALFAACGLTVEEARVMFTRLAPEPHHACKRCRGEGWVMRRAKRTDEGLTARPNATNQPRSAGGHQMDDIALELLGRIARWLAEVGQEDYRASQALQAYYGPDGGDLLVVWHLTSAGKTLLKRRGQSPKPRDAWLAEQRRLKRGGFTYHQRDRLIEGADAQAKRLLESAASLWNDVVPTSEEEHEREWCGA